MAYAYNSGRSLTSIRESLNRLQQSVFSTRKSAESVSKSLKESNVAKRRNITNSAKFCLWFASIFKLDDLSKL